jgi:tRNA A37 threonylcarbamoyladenosine dehydratase
MVNITMLSLADNDRIALRFVNVHVCSVNDPSDKQKMAVYKERLAQRVFAQKLWAAVRKRWEEV